MSSAYFVTSSPDVKGGLDTNLSNIASGDGMGKSVFFSVLMLTLPAPTAPRKHTKRRQ
jgi:hypothetical protein